MPWTITTTSPRRVDGVHRVAGEYEVATKAEAARWAVKAGASVSPALTFAGTMLRSKPAGAVGDPVTLDHATALSWYRAGYWTPDEGATVLGDHGERKQLGPFTTGRIAALKAAAGFRR